MGRMSPSSIGQRPFCKFSLFSFERSMCRSFRTKERRKNGPIAQFRLERTPDKREVTGSSPVRPTTWQKFVGGVAQLGERLPCTQEVIGSIPFTSTILVKIERWESL